mgnify:CR=1 FL=1
MRIVAHKTCGLAAQTFMISMASAGYDTCPMEGLDQYRIARLLELPKGAEVCMAISVGKRAENGVYGPRIRFDRDLFVKSYKQHVLNVKSYFKHRMDKLIIINLI